ncbi:MAG: hypothetical protein V3V06_06860, partial [Dehalococcoidia bacterium]
LTSRSEPLKPPHRFFGDCESGSRALINGLTAPDRSIVYAVDLVTLDVLTFDEIVFCRWDIAIFERQTDLVAFQLLTTTGSLSEPSVGFAVISSAVTEVQLDLATPPTPPVVTPNGGAYRTGLNAVVVEVGVVTSPANVQAAIESASGLTLARIWVLEFGEWLLWVPDIPINFGLEAFAPPVTAVFVVLE